MKQSNSQGALSRRATAAVSAGLALVLALCAGEPAKAQATGAGYQPGPAEAVVSVGKSRVIELPAPYADLMIADPKVADVLPLTTRSVYVVGKSLGSTALTVYGPGKRLLVSVNVVVSADIEGLKTRLHEVLPNEKDISVRAANQSILLSGTVSNPVSLQQVVALAQTYAPDKVVNMLGVEGTQQVMLSVRFVEMQRTVAKDLRLNVQHPSLSNPTANPKFQVTTGDTLLKGTNLLSGTFGAGLLRITGDGGNLDLLFDALETKGLVKTLAEPTLLAMSGDTANFLAGGEFPIPVQQSSGAAGSAPTITIEYKQFGVALAFTPTILRDGLINLVVNPEVSSIDPTTSVELGLIKVPGIKVRRAHTTVELRDGESFTIAGLLRDDYQASIRQYPFIGDFPVLGALFRSNGYQKDETELVIVVTPHLATPRRGVSATPADNFVPPSDFELFLFGAQQASGSVKPEDRVLMSADPTKGGVDGPHGHVLQ
jgi:pilus assembly protein CpaC